jgi:5-methylcytosine-specific restriction endonuclease McrA
MTEKKCNKCYEWKLFSEFNKAKSKKDGHQSCCRACEKIYRQENKDRVSENKRKYYQENYEHIAEYRKQRYENNKDYFIEQSRLYREEHKEDYRKYNRVYYQDKREDFLEYQRLYRKQNMDKIIAHTSRRRALKKSTSTDDPWELDQIKIFYSDCPQGFQVDHILPLSLGGAHELANLQHLEARMNNSKSSKHPDDWDDPRPVSCRG